MESQGGEDAAQHLPTMHQALGSFPVLGKKKKMESRDDLKSPASEFILQVTGYRMVIQGTTLWWVTPDTVAEPFCDLLG